MRSFAPLAVALLALACSKPAATPAADTTTGAVKDTSAMASAAAPAVVPDSPVSAVVVLYNWPKDTAAFEKYYAATHIPLVGAKAKEIGFSKAVLIKFAPNANGSKPAHYRMAQLWWPSDAAMKAGMATPGFKEVAGDIPKFSTGGQIILTGMETR
ncbi:MAG TPA: EthD family reductase [Gemmatimonadaceae bacterium]|nr:EthD family reductase [Gemmatimonadaceae bacterium]